MSKKATRPPAKFKTAHISMQVDDTKQEKDADYRKIFAQGYDWLTGTEANAESRVFMKKWADHFGYQLATVTGYGTWVAVKKSLIYRGGSIGRRFALPGNKKAKQPHGQKGVVWLSWNMGSAYGKFSVGSVHFLTVASAGNTDKKLASDRKYLRVLQQWLTRRRQLKHSTFLGGDANRDDKKYNIFQNLASFITCWDELKKWPGTVPSGRPIDFIARDKNSSRVKCVSARVLTDKQFKLNTDHFMVEAEYEVKAL